MKPFWVYILCCADDSYYTGHTDDLERRLGQHQTGECDGYTASRRPVVLAWCQECVTREEALSAEQKIKGWSRKKKEAMMRGDWAEVSRLARGKSVHASTLRQAQGSARTDLQAVVIPTTAVRSEPFDSAPDRLVEGSEAMEWQGSPEPNRRAHHDRIITTVRPELVEGREMGTNADE